MSDLFLRACRREPVERVPVWIMRQAGRYLPEYRAIRERMEFAALLKTPELAARVSLQPVARLRVDAAILFSDILVPAEPMGFRLTFNPAPMLDPPVRSSADVARVVVPDPEETVPFVYETIRTLRASLAGRAPIIGFGGAPFTLAAYLVEGKGSTEFAHVKRMIYADPMSMHSLLDKCTTMLESYLAAQVLAGAQALQVFDSWAGILSADEYREFALRYARRLFETLRREGVPLIYFVLNAAHFLETIRDCGADVISVDWRMSLAETSQRLDDGFVLQGNLDPAVLLAPPSVIADKVNQVLDDGAAAPGHIFNLGHGILPETPVEHAQVMVEAVRRHAPRVTW